MDGHLPVPIAAARERTIELLSAHFAEDRLTIDELDARLERAYAATSLAQLDELTADLPRPSTLPVPPPDAAPLARPTAERGRIVSVLSEKKHVGPWTVPPHLVVAAVMSDLTLDLRLATLHPGVTTVQVKAVMAAVKIIVPPGVRVVERINAFMGSVSTDSDIGNDVDSALPVIRLGGYAVMAEVRVRTRAQRLSEGSG